MKANLIGEMAIRKITIEEIARTINMHRNSVSNKLYGKSDFSVNDAIIIADKYFPDIDMRTLFRDTESA